MGKEERGGGREGKISPPFFIDGSQNFKMEPIKKDTEGSPSKLLFFTQCHIISYFFSSLSLIEKLDLRNCYSEIRSTRGRGV